MAKHRKAPTDQRDAFCLYALERCERDIGGVPSADKYVKWLKLQTDAAHLPKKTYIQTTYGSWAQAKARLGDSDIPNLAWTGWGNAGFRVTDALLLASVSYWLADLNVFYEKGVGLTFAFPYFRAPHHANALRAPLGDAYVAWAEATSDRHNRHPRSMATFYRHFESWNEVLANKASDLPEEVKWLIDFSAMPNSERIEIVRPLLKEAEVALGYPFTGPKFDGWAKAEAAKTDSLHRAMLLNTATSPRVRAITRSWAKSIAEVLGYAAPRSNRRGWGKASEENMLGVVRRCIAELGVKRPTLEAAQVWCREATASKNPPDYSVNTVRRHFTRWSLALDAAIGGSTT